ncbi:hypothetical protein [Duganella caerulea]
MACVFSASAWRLILCWMEHQIRAAAYWKRGGSNFHATLDD